MNAVVKSIMPDSPAAGTIIAPGDVLCKINGVKIGDVLDYKYSSYDARLALELKSAGGKLKLVRMRKMPGEDLGLVFETYLMDKERSCANQCIFCFIDQNPKGMRKTIYYKDDDVRLSFLQGNYITLTNLSRQDVERIVKLRISPVNISIHTMNPGLRAYMLGNKDGGGGIEILRELSQAGVKVNCQIVCCPGINDGENLKETVKGLIALGRGINSVSVVPVGLTKHREKLTPLRPLDKELARQIIKMVSFYGEVCLRRRGFRVFYCADELYLKAGIALPPDDFYEEYPQLENGVGMMRLFISEFEQELEEINNPKLQGGAFTVATGIAARKHLTKLLEMANEKCGNISGTVCGIRNDFFGESVTVSGLVTGRDLISQLQGQNLGSRLLIPRNMLKHGEDIFLDDTGVSDVSEALGVFIRVVKQDGADLLRAFLGE